MTKKSVGRQMRDAAKKEEDEKLKNNTVWDDVALIHNECLELIRSNLITADQLRNPALIPFYSDYKSVSINMRTLAADLLRITDEFKSIQESHAGKSGSAKTIDEYMGCIAIHQRYVAWMEHYQGVVLPTLTHLIEELGQATQALIDASKPQLTPEQDPAVVTDVVVKEVPVA